jgi:hypothetical protein
LVVKNDRLSVALKVWPISAPPKLVATAPVPIELIIWPMPSPATKPQVRLSLPQVKKLPEIDPP